ncbi:hypothetical protein [Ferrimonas marina]|uniref:Uncharacterized protein n=1 Tax=Ferrimonas marina TaxID=299255 RepID=A0A1M5U7N0_9GAMM|nr:hypothetical protein [Ferrimonas marina]SHH59065.1 hypothetical protein SAMN02745129_2445 [Ferrimonas marina]
MTTEAQTSKQLFKLADRLNKQSISNQAYALEKAPDDPLLQFISQEYPVLSETPVPYVDEDKFRSLVSSTVRSSMKSARAPLEAWLEELRQLNNEYAGCDQLTPSIELSGSATEMRLMDEGLAIAKQIAYHWIKRLRRNPTAKELSKLIETHVRPIEAWPQENPLLCHYVLAMTELVVFWCIHAYAEGKIRIGNQYGIDEIAIHYVARLSDGEVEFAKHHMRLWGLDQAARAQGFADLIPANDLTSDELRQQCALLFEDIQAMRARLLQINQFYTFELSNGFACGFRFAVLNGMLQVIIDKELAPLKALQDKKGGLMVVSLNFRGQLIYIDGHWGRAAHIGMSEHDDLRVTHYLLSGIHQAALEHYSRLPSQSDTRLDEPKSMNELDMASAIDDLISQQPDAPELVQADEPTPAAPAEEQPKPKPRLRQLRRSVVLSRLESMGVTISRAKGSELKLHRPGGRVFVLGDHGGNDRLPSFIMAKLVQRLALSHDEITTLCR